MLLSLTRKSMLFTQTSQAFDEVNHASHIFMLHKISIR